MKYIKTFENVDQPNVGYYVIIQYDYNKSAGLKNSKFDHNLNKFFSNNIGKIFGMNTYSVSIVYNILKKDVPKNIRDFFTSFDTYGAKINLELKYTKMDFSYYKEELEHIISAKKYNV